MQVDLQRGVIVAARYSAHQVVAGDADRTAPTIAFRATSSPDRKSQQHHDATRKQTHYFTTAGPSPELRIPATPSNFTFHRLNLS